MIFSLILADTSRSYMYLKNIIKENISVENILIYSNKKHTKLRKLCLKNKLDFLKIKTKSINSKISTKKILSIENKNFIFSGYPGEIVKNEILLKKNFFHCHPGKLPEFKGSTTIYYTLLLKKNIYCSVIKISSKIDSGEIFFERKFNKPLNKIAIEKKFDDKIRSITICEFLKKKKLKKIKYKSPKKYLSSYYICHPLLRQLIIKKGYLNFSL